MSTECTHTLKSGHQCNAPAISGSTFCRHHHTSRPHKPAQSRKRQSEPIELPPLGSMTEVLVALDEVVQALAGRRIKRSVAATLISGLKFAFKIMKEIDAQSASEIGSADAEAFPSAATAPPSEPTTARPNHSAAEDVYEPTQEDLEEFARTLRNGSAEQVLDQMEAKQRAWAAQRSAAPSAPHLATVATLAAGRETPAALNHRP